jgi:hypothetical protein
MLKFLPRTQKYIITNIELALLAEDFVIFLSLPRQMPEYFFQNIPRHFSYTHFPARNFLTLKLDVVKPELLKPY